MHKQSVRVPRSCVVQTPGFLAAAMVDALEGTNVHMWLEPCVGEGALLQALSTHGVKRDRIFGLDVDGRSQPNDRFARVKRGQEFLAWSQSTKQRFDRVIANPPYIAIERLSSKIRSAALKVSLSRDVKVDANANAWFAFLCAAIKLLRTDGSLCFLLPAAWDYSNYAEPLRRTIGEYFRTVHVFRTAAPIFRADKVEEGAVVLIAKGRLAQSEQRSVSRDQQRFEVATSEELIRVLRNAPMFSRRWNTGSVTSLLSAKNAKGIRSTVGDYVSLRLGIVTGDSSYFLLTEGQRRERNLPLASVVPVLSRAKHLASAGMTQGQWRELRDFNERVWLFSPSKKSTQNSAVQSYLRFGKRGGCDTDGLKISMRDPWFQMTLPAAPDGFMSGMSSTMPWLCFRKAPKLVATNTLYLVNFLDDGLKPALRLAFAMALLTSDVRDQLKRNGRTYAGGLLKHEPSDLLSVRLPPLEKITTTWQEYNSAIVALQRGDERTARALADASLEAKNNWIEVVLRAFKPSGAIQCV